MAIPVRTENPATEDRDAHTVVITVTYAGEVTEKLLQTWRDTIGMFEHESCSVNYGATTRPKGKEREHWKPCNKH